MTYHKYDSHVNRDKKNENYATSLKTILSYLISLTRSSDDEPGEQG